MWRLPLELYGHYIITLDSLSAWVTVKMCVLWFLDVLSLGGKLFVIIYIYISHIYIHMRTIRCYILMDLTSTVYIDDVR